jgi:ABC-type amino acid transport substrate-binding protein
MRKLAFLTLAAITFGLAGPIAAREDLLSRVKAAGAIRIANTQGHAPWDFLNDKNELVGLGVDLGRELAKRMGIADVEFIPTRFPDLIPGVQADRFDLVIASHIITEERAKVVGFSKPYMEVGTSVFIRKGDPRIKALDDIDDKSIGTLAGSITEKYLTENHANKKLDLRAYENATLALSDFAAGRVDALIYSDDSGAYIARINNLPVRPAVPVSKEVNAMVFKKGEIPFEEALNAAYTSIRDDGTYSALSSKWLGTLDMAASSRKLPTR